MHGKLKITSLMAALALAGLAGGAQADVFSNLHAEATWLDDPNVTDPPPSTADIYMRMLESVDALGSDEPGGFGHDTGGPVLMYTRSYEARTLTVSNAWVDMWAGFSRRLDEAGNAMLSLSNGNIFRPALVVGDSADSGVAALDLNWGVVLQSTGFALLGAPSAAGRPAEGILRLKPGATWWHQGAILIGQEGGAGRLVVEHSAELSGGLSADRPNIIVGRNPLTRLASDAGMAQLEVAGRLFGNELLVEGEARSSGDVTVALLGVQRGGEVEVTNPDRVLHADRAEVGVTGAGTLRVFGAAAFGDATVQDFMPKLALGTAAGGHGELLLEKIHPQRDARLTVAGKLAMAEEGGTALLEVRAGGEASVDGELRAAAYSPDSDARIVVEGAGSRLAVDELWLGANSIMLFYGGSGPGAEAGTGHLTVRDGGLLEVNGHVDTYSYQWFGETISYTTYYSGSLVAGPGTLIDGNGTIRVSDPDPAGDGLGDVHVFGSLSPGNSPGRLTVEGNLTLGAGARLVIELGGTTPGSGYDVLEVSGTLNLTDAILELRAYGDFTPTAGQSFAFLRAGDFAGAFASLVDNTGLGLELGDLDFGPNGSFGINVSAVPLPAAGWLLLGGIGVLLRAGRRRSRQGTAAA